MDIENLNNLNNNNSNGDNGSAPQTVVSPNNEQPSVLQTNEVPMPEAPVFSGPVVNQEQLTPLETNNGLGGVPESSNFVVNDASNATQFNNPTDTTNPGVTIPTNDNVVNSTDNIQFNSNPVNPSINPEAASPSQFNNNPVNSGTVNSTNASQFNGNSVNPGVTIPTNDNVVNPTVASQFNGNPINPGATNPSTVSPSQFNSNVVNPLPPVNGNPQGMPEAPVLNGIDLHPEGMASLPEPEVPQPLMGSTLTSDTPLVNQAPKPESEPINNNNTISPVENPISFGGVVVPPNTPDMSNTLPPDIKPKKKKSKKGLVLILVLILILGIGFGVYYFLNIAKPTVNILITPKIEHWELGEELPTNVSDFATVTGVDVASCKVDSSTIDVKKSGNYSYTVTCPGAQAVTKNIQVNDTKGPVVSLKEVHVVPNTNVELDNFVTKCEDASLESLGCDIKIEDSTINLKELVKKSGTYTIPLVIKDDLNNETRATATLVVDDEAPAMTVSCSSKPASTETTTKITNIYEYGISADNKISTTKKVVMYVYSSKDEYEKVKKEYDPQVGIDGIISDATFNDDEQSVSVVANMTLEEITSELSFAGVPTGFEDLVVYHEGRGDTCDLS